MVAASDSDAGGASRLWEVAVLLRRRDAFPSRDTWLAQSRRFGGLKEALIPVEVAHATPRVAMPFEPEAWLSNRKARMADALHRLARAAWAGATPGGSIEDGTLKVDRLNAAVPEDADALVLDRYGRLPEVRVTDLLLEVDAEVGFTEAFTHLRTGVVCKDRIGILNVLLAEGLNLGLSKIAGATNTHDVFQLSRLSRWHVERTLLIIDWLLDADMRRRAQIGLNKGDAAPAWIARPRFWRPPRHSVGPISSSPANTGGRKELRPDERVAAYAWHSFTVP